MVTNKVLGRRLPSQEISEVPRIAIGQGGTGALSVSTDLPLICLVGTLKFGHFEDQFRWVDPHRVRRPANHPLPEGEIRTLER